MRSKSTQPQPGFVARSHLSMCLNCSHALASRRGADSNTNYRNGPARIIAKTAQQSLVDIGAVAPEHVPKLLTPKIVDPVSEEHQHK